MHPYQYEINNIIRFYIENERFPYVFTENEYEIELFKTMTDLIQKCVNYEIEFDKIGDLKMILNNYDLTNELEDHLEFIETILKSDPKLDFFEQYPVYIQNVIQYIQQNRYILPVSLYKKIDSIPNWKWKLDNSKELADKLYEFVKINKRMPIKFTWDVKEYELFNFVQLVYFQYVYGTLSFKLYSYLTRDNFPFDKYSQSGYCFLQRYCKEYDVYEMLNNTESFEYNFNLFFKYFREYNRIPHLYSNEYRYLLQIKKLYYENKLTFLQKSVMVEFPGFDWSITICLDTKNQDTAKTELLDSKLIENMLKRNKVKVRTDYNYGFNHMRIRPCSTNTNSGRICKKKAKLRIALIKRFEELPH